MVLWHDYCDMAQLEFAIVLPSGYLPSVGWFHSNLNECVGCSPSKDYDQSRKLPRSSLFLLLFCAIALGVMNVIAGVNAVNTEIGRDGSLDPSVTTGAHIHHDNFSTVFHVSA